MMINRPQSWVSMLSPRRARAYQSAFVLTFLCVSTAFAALSPVPYYDDFTYSDAASLVGTNGWSQFTTGPGYGILPVEYHGWVGYPGGNAIASNAVARLTGLQLVNKFGTYTKQPGVGAPSSTGAFDKPSVATLRFKVDLSEATGPTNGLHKISRLGNIFWPTSRWHYENQSSYYTMMPVVRAFVRTNGLVTAYSGNVMTNLTHTPITNSATITLTLNYETFKWSLWVDDELAANDLGLFKPYMGNSPIDYSHMMHDGWYKDYDGLKEIGFVDNSSNGASLVDQIRLFADIPSSKALPMIENFETRVVDGQTVTFVPGNVNGQNGYFARDAVVSTDAQHTNEYSVGAQGVQINAGGEIFEMFLDKQTNVWSDLYLGPVASGGGSGTAHVDLGGGHAVFYVEADGSVHAYDGATATNIATVATNGWTRFTVAQDYVSSTWDLYVDGSIVQSNLAFKGAGIANSYEEFRVFSVGDAVVYLDDIVLSTESPFNIPSVSFATDAEEIAVGITEVTVTATLSWAFGQPITVPYVLRGDGTAMQVYDYNAGDGAFAFLPGETVKSFTFTISRDNFSYAEYDDSLTFAITNLNETLVTAGVNDVLTYTIRTTPDHFHVIPFTESFEHRELGSLDGQRGWNSKYVDVQTSDVYAGSQAAKNERLGGSLSHAFSNEAMNVSIQWREKLVLAQHEPTPPVGSTYAFYADTNGYIVAFDGATSTNLGNVVTVSGGTWTHFRVDADYNSQKWTLTVNGIKVLQDFDFFDNSATSYRGFEVHGKFTIDNIQIGYGPPSTPINLVAVAVDGEVALSWASAQGATTYRLKRGTNPGGPYSLIASLPNTQFTDTSVLNGITYYYVVSARNAMGDGNDSAEAQAIPRAKVTGLAATAGIGQITLDWDTYAGATNYYIKRGNASGGPYTIIASTNVNSYLDASAANGRTYYYIVYAETDAYTSLDSDEVAQAPALRTIFYDSFESPVVDLTEHENMLIPNWEIRMNVDDTLNDRGGIVDSGTSPQEFAPRHGNQCAWVWNGRYIETTSIEEVLEEEAYYKLSFNVAAEFGLGEIFYKVELLAGETVLSDVTATWHIGENDFDRSDVIEFTTPIGHADIGQPLKLRFRYLSGDYHYVMGVDNVRLETSIDPPPVLPDPLAFSVAPAPAAGSKTKIDMTSESVTNGVGPILYNFENITTGNSSGWSDLTSWESTGLTPGTEYGFRVRARDFYGNQNAWSDVVYAETFGANLMTNNVGADSWNNTNNWKNSAAPVGEETARIASNITAVVGSAPPAYDGNLILDAGSSLEFADAVTAAVLPGSGYQIQLNAGSQLRAFTTVAIDAAVVLLGDAEVLGSSGGDRITFARPISGSGKLTLAGDDANDFYMNAANSMSGGVVTRDAAGTGFSVFVNVNGAFGSSDVAINTNASLHIGAGLNNVISNGATLYLNGAEDGSGGSSGYKVVLGSSETVYQLYIDGVVQPRGTHGGLDSGADYTNSTVFVGTGLLTVTVGDDDIYDLSSRDVTDSSAVLEGKLDVPFTSRVARVYWSTNNNANGTEWLGDGNASSAVLNTYSEKVGQGLIKGLINLQSNTRYYFTFSASNAVDVIWGTNDTFETVGPPVINNTGTSATGDATATLSGILTVGSFAEITFVWAEADDGTNSIYDWDNIVALSGLQAQDQPFTTSISGLTYGKPYYYRIMGENALGVGWSDIQTILSEAPHSGATMLVGVTGTQATNIAQTAATLQGELDAPRSVFTVHAYWSSNNNASASAWETDPAAQTVEIGSYANASDIALSTDVTGLVHDTIYYYTFVATNAATNIWASNVAFGTPGSPAVDSSAGASNVVGSIVSLQGELTDGFSADAYFVWDTEDKGISGTNAWTNVVSAGSVTEGYVFGSSVTGFIYGLEYTYRVYVTNGYGEDWSTSQTFYALAPVNPDSAAYGGSATNIYTDGDGKQWYAHIFTENDTFTVPEGLQAEYLIVGGGGGGGGVRGPNTAAGGGGAGGFLTGSESIMSGSHTIVVGAGGAGAAGAYDSGGARGAPGANSSAFSLTALGGGGGAYNLFTTGRDGGSGGGGATSDGIGGAGTAGQGYAGGNAMNGGTSATIIGGGGGGAGGIGGTPDGGTGIVSGISGGNVAYAAGGKGGVFKVSNTEAGAANTGNGGSGGSADVSYSGAAGGSGIVIIRYEVVPGVDLSVVNTVVTNVADTAVDIQGELDALSAIVDVYAYWSTNSHVDAAGWQADADASNVLVSSYYDIVDQPLSYSLTGLTADTTYYYTFMATNALTNIWATPAQEFGTKGVPVASSQPGATDFGYGTARLQGVLTSGGIADAWFVWDAGDRSNTSTGDWAHVESVGSQLQAVEFDQVISGLLYGVSYDYRVFVTNEHGVGWSSPVSFTSTVPESAGTPLVAIQNTTISNIAASSADIHAELDATQSVFTVTAYWSTNNNADVSTWVADLDAGSALVGTYTNVVGEAIGATATGLDSDTVYYFTFIASNVSTSILDAVNGTFASLGAPVVELLSVTDIAIGTGSLVAELTGGGSADAWMVWGDEDGLTTSTSDWDHVMSIGQIDQNFVYTNSISNLLYGVTHYAGLYATNALGTDWSTITNFTTLIPAGVEITGRLVTGVGNTTATLQATLDATQSVYTVYAFWSTNDNADAAEWIADSSMLTTEVGTYTNVVGEDVSASVTGLDSATTYYYAFMASNVVSELWTANISFTTAGVPGVSATGVLNDDPGNIGLGGLLTAGSYANATFVWGETDGLTNSVGDWEHAEVFGVATQDLAFAVHTTLLFGKDYVYRIFVTNDSGSVWSDAVSFSPSIPQVPWTPAVGDVDMVAWYDAADADTILTDASGVYRWNDKSGNNLNATQSTNDRKPAFNAADANLNNRPTIGPGLGGDNVANWLTTGVMTNKNVYIVAYYNGASFASGTYQALLKSSTGAVQLQGSPNSSAWATVGLTVYRDGDTNSTTTALPMGPTLWTAKLGTELSGENYHILSQNRTDSWAGWQTGSIGEIIFTDGAEDLVGQQRMEGYLAHTWGTAGNLVSAHPYKSYRPTIPGNFGITNAAATDVLASTAMLHGELDASNSVVTVTAYWSVTSNATVQAWNDDGTKGSAVVGTYTNVMGQPLSVLATNLAEGTTYYYTLVASNAATNLYAAPNPSFLTIASEPPVVATAGGATNLIIGGATLQGVVTTINGTLSDVRIYYGAEDGGTTAANWDANVALDPGSIVEGVAFSTNVTGLLYGNTNYYRVFATNAYGAAWSAPVVSFTTPAPAITITNTSAANVLTTAADLQGTLDATGAIYTVLAFWSTNDNGSASVWSNDTTKGRAVVGTYTNVSAEPLSVNVTGLTLNTPYYYTLVASNAFTNVWATPNISFTTANEAPPVVGVGDDATGVAYQEATLNGIITTFNGALNDVRIYMGATDRGMTTVGWDTNFVFSLVGISENVAFSTNLTGLTEGAEFFYRVYATNAYGEAWTDPVVSFTTLTAADGTWLGVSGNWTNESVWVSGTVARGTDRTASFTGVDITTAQNITNDTAMGIGHIVFTDLTTASHDLTIAGSAPLTLTVSSNTPTINVTQSGRTLTIGAPLAGTQGLTKTGPGNLTLSGASSYAGGTTITDGRLIVSATDSSLGDPSGGITFTGTEAALLLPIGTFTLDANRTITAQNGAMAAIARPNTSNNGTINIGGKFTGDGGFQFSNGYQLGGVTFNSTNLNHDFKGALRLGGNYTGSLTFTPSVLTLNIASLADGVGYGNITFGKGNNSSANNLVFAWSDSAAGPLVLNHRSIQLDSQVETAQIQNNNSNPANTITISNDLIISRSGNKILKLSGSNTGDNTFAGAITNRTDAVISVTKEGNGKWVLSGTNTYTGNTTVSAGTLAVANSEALPDATHLLISSGKIVDLAAGVRAEVSALTLGGAAQASGMYGSTSSAATNQSAYFAGTGLLYVGVKAPTVQATTAANVTLSTADLQGVLDVEAESMTVTAYWSTNNNTTAQAWIDDSTKQSATGGAFGNVTNQALSVQATGLTQGTTHYYTFAATNAATTIWAIPGASFTTVAPASPVVGTAGGVTNIIAGGATLQGVVTTINGTLSDVRIYFGTSDGGTTAANWDTNFVFTAGDIAEGVTFSTNVTGLLYGQTYAYRVYATNAFGATWSDAVTGILTAAPAGIGVTNTTAANVTQLTADLGGELDATGSVFTVTAYFSASNNLSTASWAADGTKGSELVGSYTNVVDQVLTVSAENLTPGTTYYYTFVATNAATNLWASPNGTFDTAAAPVLDAVTPANGATEVALDAQLVASFDAVVNLMNGGNITLTNLTDATASVITLPNAQVSAVDSTNLVINLTADFAEGKTFAVLIGANTILAYAGLSDTNVWAFTTATPSTTPPALLSVSPVTGATAVDPAVVLEATFVKNVVANAGNIVITNITSGGTIAIPVTSSQVSFAGAVMTINPTAYLDRSATYAVLIANDVIRDTYGNAYAGITSASTWRFTTAPPGGYVLTVYGVTGNPGGNWPNYAGHLTDMLNGNLSYDFGVTDHIPAIDTSADPNDPSVWTFNPGNYESEWSPNTGYQDPSTSLNNKIAWVVMDLGSETADLASMYLWNATTTAAGSQVDTYNVYYASGVGIDALPAMPKSKGFAGDYDFSSGDWTKLNTEGILTLPVNTTKPRVADTNVNLNGVSARYVAIEIITNHGHADAVGLGQVELTAFDTTRPTITNTVPEHSARYVEQDAAIVASFDEDIVANTGDIELRLISGPTGSIMIPVDGAQVTIEGSTLTIQPSSLLIRGAEYAVLIDPGAVTDSAGNGFAGITDTVTWQFKVVGDPEGSIFRFR